MRLYLKSDHGELEFERITWDGHNTESARRLAAIKINAALAACQATEGRDEVPCCIIGHSHGGSAIAAALLNAAGNGYRHNALKRWITVASPFISLSRSRLLFSRLRQKGGVSRDGNLGRLGLAGVYQPILQRRHAHRDRLHRFIRRHNCRCCICASPDRWTAEPQLCAAILQRCVCYRTEMSLPLGCYSASGWREGWAPAKVAISAQCRSIWTIFFKCEMSIL
jgi:hypothetical protein